MNESKKRNVIIGSLCAVLLLMVVGYAAFSTTLNINGTANISSTWNILITDITSNPLSGNASNASEPTGKGTLTATFNTNLVSPGDSMEYNITVSNQGTLNAVLSKITVSDGDNPAIKYTVSGLQQGDPLNAGASATLTAKVEYVDIAEGQGQPESTESSLTVTLDYVQEGTAITPTNNVVYRYTTDSLNIGDSIDGIQTTTNPTTLDKSIYLKHEIDSENKITASYVCFVTDTEHCIQGGDNGTAFETNKATLQSQEAWFTNNGGSCSFDSGVSECRSDGFGSIRFLSYGYVSAYNDSLECTVDGDGGGSGCN